MKRITNSLAKDEKALSEATTRVSAAERDIERCKLEIKQLEAKQAKEEKILEAIYDEFVVRLVTVTNFFK